MKHARVILASLAIAAPAVGVACVLADPPPIQQPASLDRPIILTDSVSPPLDQKITAPPTGTPLTFSVPVRVSPDQSVKYRVFVDLQQSATSFDKLISVTDDGGATGTLPDAGDSVRALGFQFPSSTPIDFGACHTFTFVVAYDFIDNQSPNPIDPPGGDQVTWFYEPIADCTYYDAAPPTYDASDGASE
jgi:hypothetical protein